MATSTRKKRMFRAATKPDRLPSKKKPKPKKKLSPHKKSSDKYSYQHLAKVLMSGQRIAMLNAVDRLKGRSRVLVELAAFSSFQYVRLAAISNLSGDVWGLIEIAKYCQYADTRSAALDELSSHDEALVEISCSSLFKDTRLEAVSLINEPALLATVATGSPNKDSRMAALERVSGHSKSLARVANQSSYRTSRAAAVKHLKFDTNALCRLLKSSKHTDVRKNSALQLVDKVDELDDVESIAEMAKVCPSEDARYLAIGRLSEYPTSLRDVVYNSRYKDARSTALMLLSDVVEELDDAEMLTEIAILSPYEDCRAAAMERIAKKSAALLAVASRSKYKDSRETALEKLKKDPDALKTISKLSRYKDTRKRAHSIVSSPEVFRKELSKILG
ncbi:hypothetical protein GF318_05805 [Candidatus Micrarchaeota archaeon]|nr:hypothetical protein [Candidatus Micrarchaeota archaeon]